MWLLCDSQVHKIVWVNCWNAFTGKATRGNYYRILTTRHTLSIWVASRHLRTYVPAVLYLLCHWGLCLSVPAFSPHLPTSAPSVLWSLRVQEQCWQLVLCSSAALKAKRRDSAYVVSVVEGCDTATSITVALQSYRPPSKSVSSVLYIYCLLYTSDAADE